MADNDTDLTTRQQRTIAALLAARNVREAAKQVKVPERTVYTWLAEPAFRAALYAAEGHLIDAATRRLLHHQDVALTVILTIMANPDNPAGVRLRAAQSVLEQLLKLRELRNIEQRLTALETLYAQSAG
jgi:flagellar motility protein MotE (MotC chaperone)